MKKIWQQWNEFWFSPVSLLNLAVFRILFCTTMALMYWNRQKDLTLFFTEAGILPKALALKVIPEGMRPGFLLAFWSDAWVPVVHGLFIFILILMALGVGGRLLGLVAVFLQLSFLFRNYGVSFGADQVGTIFLFYLAFTQSSSRLSVQEWWRKKRNLKPVNCDSVTSVFYRFLQIQLCVIYAYSGMEKLKGMSWWDGTAVWSVLANSQMVIADFTWVRHFPLLVVLITFGTLLFELYFPVLVWVKPLRKYFLAAGVAFHVGIGIVMALWSFALVMVSPYALFLPESFTEGLLKRIKGPLRS